MAQSKGMEIESIERPEVSIMHAKAQLCRNEFFYFVQTFWSVVIPEEPLYNWHIEYLCTELQQMVERVVKRQPKEYDLIINIPPGTSKSTIATVMLPVWAWINDPTIRNLTASYSATLSTDHALKSRDILRSELFKAMFPHIKPKGDQDNKTHYKNTHGGERYATSVTGTVTGFHAHIIVVDDPLNAKGGTSEADRDTANRFMDYTLSTRKVSKAVTPTILVMQRLHENDPTGNWLSKEDKSIKHICLPGELSNDVKPPELKQFYIDGLLDTLRLTAKDLKELKGTLGSYGYAGQIMQTPSPEGGGIWKKWIIPIKDKDIPTELLYMGTDWDLAYTAKETNSACAYITAGLHDNKMYITDLGFDWLEFPAMLKYIKSKGNRHYIEGKASGKSAIQSLLTEGLDAVEVQVIGGDKIARATMASPSAEAGRVYCTERLLNKLYHDSKQGILLFPNAQNDDLNDALVQSINRLLGRPQIFTF